VQRAISEMVQLSSSVIEEQIRAGQAAAARLRDDLSTSEKLNGDITTLVHSLATATKDIGNAWVDLLTIVISAIGAKPPSGDHPPRPNPTGEPTRTLTGSSGGARTTSCLTPSDPNSKAEPAEIAVTGYGVKEVTLDLRPPSMRFVPLVQPLVTSDRRNSLGGVKFSLDPQRKLVLAVDVPRGQPPGTYTGLIVDSTTNKSGGAVSVTVGA